MITFYLVFICACTMNGDLAKRICSLDIYSVPPDNRKNNFTSRTWDKRQSSSGRAAKQDFFGSVIFLDTDEKVIIYLEARRIGKDGVVHLEISRYQVDGRLV